MFKLDKLTKNSAYNLAGSALPFLVGLFTIPRLVRALGMERFSVLTLSWVVLGYFSLFDLGLGRVLTQVVAERTSIGDDEDLPDLIRTGLVMLGILGILGGICLSVLSPIMVGKFLKVPPVLYHEVLLTFLMMGAAIPAVTLLGGLRGLMEARQDFLSINILRLCMGAVTFLGPWMVTFATINLAWVVMTLVVMRYAAMVAHYWVARRKCPELCVPSRFRRKHWAPMLRFGGWMTISNIISPLMVSMDRFFIGSFVPLAAVAYYVTPFEMITKLLIFPVAIVSALFPMFGALHLKDTVEVKKLYNKGLLAVLMVIGPATLGIALGARLILSLWLNRSFGEHGAAVLQILCLGVLVNALANVPFSFIQGVARPDLTAKFHLMEIPVYVALLWFLGTRFGVAGVAWAWTIRVSMDFLLLFIAANRLQRSANRALDGSQTASC